MKHIFLILSLLGISFSLVAQKKKAKPTPKLLAVQGTITETSTWCGGARPTEEIVAELNRPTPLVNYKLYIRKDTNDLSKEALFVVQTDSFGNFTIKLPEGKYVVVNEKKGTLTTYKQTIEKYKVETNMLGAIDINCYQRFISQPDFIINITKSTKQPIKIVYNFVKKCSWHEVPCAEYKGPLPQ